MAQIESVLPSWHLTKVELSRGRRMSDSEVTGVDKPTVTRKARMVLRTVMVKIHVGDAGW